MVELVEVEDDPIVVNSSSGELTDEDDAELEDVVVEVELVALLVED